MILKKGDGISRSDREMHAEIVRLQSLLGLEADGKFGGGTEAAVIAFQKERGLGADGVVGPATWKALEAKSGGETAETKPVARGMRDFRGDLGWIHAREGHDGGAYWPGGVSGVTLDPGFDLGHASKDLFEEAYKDILSAEEMEVCRGVLGIQGDAAMEEVKSNSGLRKIKVSREQADEVFPFVATPYWEKITARYPTLLAEDCPGSVQTALLSISFNRGPNNRKLSVLDKPLADKDWQAVADAISSMQQDHQLEGIRKRRRMEGELINRELNPPSTSDVDLDTLEGRQLALKLLGYEISVDGQWGNGSKAVLKQFQADKGLDADGLWGPNTRKALEKALASI